MMARFGSINVVQGFFRLLGSNRQSQAAPPRYLLQARRLSFRRGYHSVLRTIDLTVAPGETVAILGANGVGKTTLLKCLAGAMRPTSGEVRWRGEAAARNAMHRRHLGFAGHEPGIYFDLTARENLLLAGRLYGIDRVSERAAECLKQCGLHKQAQQRVRALSRGMRQRLAIIRATIHQPEIVILDEPFTNLDSDGRQWLVSYLESLHSRPSCVLFSSHDSVLARRLADRVLKLQAGQLRELEGSFNSVPEPERAWTGGGS
jgi:heme ABC exporter ATP-binding subunit CcmA